VSSAAAGHETCPGLANYQKLIGDQQFWDSLWITTRYVLFNIPLQTVLALALAVLLARLTSSLAIRGLVLLRYLLPMLMVTLVWMTILDYEFGPIDGFLKWLGLSRVPFLNQGLAVDSDFHGKNSTGYNPGAIDWNLTAWAFVPLVTK